MSPRSLCAAAIATVLLLVGASAASASPGAYRILFIEANCGSPADNLAAAVLAQSDVAAVDQIDDSSSEPSLATLQGYDEVVSMSDCDHADAAALGDELADYVDGGGVVVMYPYDHCTCDAIGGRWVTDGYSPVGFGNNDNVPRSLGAYDASDPLMAGVSDLTSESNDSPPLAAGGRLVASWTDSGIAVATKGRVLAVTNCIGDECPWTGDYGRLTVNAVRVLSGGGPGPVSAPPYVSSLPPVVSAISPATGPAGTSVGISGENFDATTQVLFGTTPAAFVIDGFKHLTAKAPAGVQGTVDIRVVSPNGTSAAAAADRFAFVGATGPASVGTPASAKRVCVMPDLARHTYRGAKRIMRRAGCPAPQHSGHAKRPPSHVKSQTPKAGTTLFAGDTASMTLG